VNIDLPYEDRQYGNVYFRHFTGSRKAKSGLEETLENQLVHSKLIDRLIDKNEKEDQVVDRQMNIFLQKLHKAFSFYSQNDPATARRLGRLIAELAAFSESRNDYQIRIQPLPLGTLKNISAERKAARSSAYLGSRHVLGMQARVRQYRDNLYFHHDLFTGLMEQETEQTGKVTVSSPRGRPPTQPHNSHQSPDRRARSQLYQPGRVEDETAPGGN
jgi:hypothetical protein